MRWFEGRLAVGTELLKGAVEWMLRGNVMEVPVAGRLPNLAWKLFGFRNLMTKTKSAGSQTPFCSSTHEIACVGFAFNQDVKQAPMET